MAGVFDVLVGERETLLIKGKTMQLPAPMNVVKVTLTALTIQIATHEARGTMVSRQRYAKIVTTSCRTSIICSASLIFDEDLHRSIPHHDPSTT